MKQHELRDYYQALAEQAEHMDLALEAFERGWGRETFWCLLRWAEFKYIAREIADAHDTMAFAKAMGMSDGVKKAWEET